MDSILLFVATYAVFFIGFLVWALFFAASLRWLDGKPMVIGLSVLSLMVVVVLLVSALRPHYLRTAGVQVLQPKHQQPLYRRPL